MDLFGIKDIFGIQNKKFDGKSLEDIREMARASRIRKYYFGMGYAAVISLLGLWCGQPKILILTGPMLLLQGFMYLRFIGVFKKDKADDEADDDIAESSGTLEEGEDDEDDIDYMGDDDDEE